RRVPRLADDRAAVHGEPVRRGRSRDADVRHASSARRAGVAAPSSRRRTPVGAGRLTGQRPALPAGRPGLPLPCHSAEGGAGGGTMGSPANVTGGILLSQGLAPQVPSARAGLTSLFGMGRGISPSL